MLQILIDEIRPAAALGASGWLGLVIAVSGTTSIQAGVKEIITKPATATKAATAATRTAKATSSRSTTSRSAGSQAGKARLISQSESPLDRLRERDAEQRLRDALDESSGDQPNPFVQPDQITSESQSEEPSELPVNPKAKSVPTSQPIPQNVRPKVAEEVDVTPPLPEPKSKGKRFDPVAQSDSAPKDDSMPEPVTSPAHLKKITEIQPFFDYQPASSLKGDVCWELCPRPDGLPCPADPETGFIPECPSEFQLSEQAYLSRSFADCLYQWRASDLYHNPLYFEDPGLERYGHTHHCLVQPFASVGKFGVQLVGLPYQMTIDPMWKKMYNLGYYRPGECAPKKYYRIPWNTHAAINEAGIWTGLFFLFP